MLDLSIIIPFKDKSELTISCLNSIKKYGPSCKEILLISNGSSASELNAVKKIAGSIPNTKVEEHNVPFNFQEINNWGIANTTGKAVLLLNNDVDLVSESRGILDKMYQKCQKSGVGAVGCVLVYEDRRTIQHAGVYLVPGGTADHLYIGTKLQTAKKGVPVSIAHDFEVTAVTAAAVMVERRKLKEINNLNEDFIICGGDVDMCLRLKDKGYGSWLIGLENGYMIHKESKSRSMISVPYVDFTESYKSYVKHFSLDSGDIYLPWKEISDAKQKN